MDIKSCQNILFESIKKARLIQANRKERHQSVQTDNSTELPSDKSLYDIQQELVLKLKKFFECAPQSLAPASTEKKAYNPSA